MSRISIQVRLKLKSDHIAFYINFTQEVCNLIKMNQYTQKDLNHYKF